MENLDELMRKKFDSDDPAGRFEFREEFWEQAQVLIEADEARRRKRRRWLIWWLFFGLCVAIGGWWGSGSWNSGSGSLGDEKSRLDGSFNNSGGSLGNNNSAGSPGGNGSNAAAGDEVANGSEAGKGAAIGTNDGVGAGVEDWNAKNTGREPLNDSKNSAFQNKGNQGNAKNGATRQPARTQNHTATRQGGKGQNNTPVNVDGLQPSALAAGSVDAKQPRHDSNNPFGADIAKNGVNQADGHATTGQAIASAGSALADSMAADQAARNEWKNITVFPALPVGPGYLELPKRTVDTQTVDAFVKIIKPLRESKFRFGLSATGSLSQASPDGKRLGFTGGALVRYNLTQTWSIASGLQWRYLSGAWARDTGETGGEQIKYSFGYKLDTWQLETQGMHLIEAPIGLRWKQGAFAFEGGLTPGFLVAVQGQLTKGHMESLQDGLTTETSKVWLEKKAYHSFVPSFFLGGEWLATRRIGLTLRATLRPGKVGPKLSDTPPPANLFWLDAGLRWYF